MQSRDDIPAVLIGLALWCNRPVREKIFKILRRHVRAEGSHSRGRPGMDLWCIFVLGTLKQTLGCDYDRLKELVDDHRRLRRMLGFSELFPLSSYGLQTIIDNVSLLIDAVLEEINAVVVSCGHERLKHVSDAPLACPLADGCTSSYGFNAWFVTEFRTHLFGPQGPRLAQVQGVDTESIPGLPVGRSKNLGKLRAYLSLCRKLLQRARQTMAQLEEQNICTDTLEDY